ncbi:uncharacterized protein LOC113160167 isoform X2 [Anabas testudineus]|uniref:uncharacterized protein LOC113160167 isoform X2 n=1 Tax=Anabas testudineus TaxID=64144 RepID=UPI000E465241|nr:uncharacterized protein LOC113160167 isoform X2 [Anabas testudineus]
MSPPQQLVHRRPLPDTTAQKVLLTYKLLLLENASRALEQDLRNFTNEACKEVQGFLNSSFSTSVFSNLATTLDKKYQAVNRLSAVLKDIESQVSFEPSVKNGDRTNQLQPVVHKGILKTDVLKFGPMLQNVLMASSIAKAVQVLGATLSLRQLKHFLISQSAAIQDDDMICSISSSYNSAIQTTNFSCDLKAEEEEQSVILEETCQSDNVILPPVIIQSSGIDLERPPLLLPPIQAVFPEISNPKPMKKTPLISWGTGDDVAVQHQKQTSSQLLHFLRAKAKFMSSLEVTVTGQSKSICTLGSSQQMSPNVKSQNWQLRHVATDDVVNTLAPKTLCADIENEPPVFKVKRVESSGSLTYTWVIATKTELWDIGDIFTEVEQGEQNECVNSTARVENPRSDDQWKTQSLQCTEPEKENNSAGAKMPVINSINIPGFQIRRFEETEVVVSHIVSPGNFYIQHVDSSTKLQALVTDWKATSSYALQSCIPDIGTLVMGWFPLQEQWCRAQVTKICGVSRDNNPSDSTGNETSIKVEVKRLDFGDTACLSLLNIKELTPDLAVLPLQALQVSLANVMPVNGRDWSEQAVGWFKAILHNRTLYARLYPQGSKVTVELFLEKGKLGAMRRGATLSLRLAQNGHAKHNKLKNVGLIKTSAGQLKTREQDLDWEKYLISCYAQKKK